MEDFKDYNSQLTPALIRFNASMEKILKNANNPMFKNNYATVDQIIEVIRPILAKNNLAIMQFPKNEGDKIGVKTVLIHSSGETMESDYFFVQPVAQIVNKETKEKIVTPQSVGSAITYARRYSLTSFLCLNTGEDDDGNKSSGRNVVDTISKDKLEIFRNIGETKEVEEVKSLLKKYGYSSSSKIKIKDYAAIVADLKALKDKDK